MQKLAMIAAFPPPVTGQSLAADLLRKGLEKAGIPLVEIDLAEPIGGISTFKRLLQLAKLELKLAVICVRCRDLVVYLQLGHGKSALLRDLFFMATARVFRHPCVAHVHGSGFRKALEALPAPIRFIEKKLIKQLKAAVVLSDSLREMFSGLLDDERIISVDNGIDEEFTQIALGEPERRLHDHMNVLFLSNFLTAKGYADVLQAAVYAKKYNKDFHFTIIGADVPDQIVDAREFVRDYELDNVTIRDVVWGEDKHQAYLDADVFILPSFYEGQPLCILEAMFESLPVVTTRVGGIPEIFSDETGVRYVEPGSPEQIFEALCILDEAPDSLLVMGKANRKLALERFTAQGHIAKMLDIILK